MRPIKFKEATIELEKPAFLTDEECSSLHIYKTNEGTSVSCWTVSIWARIKFLFHGKIWLGVYVKDKQQPPVWLDCGKTVFID